jgi:hypothetical protein
MAASDDPLFLELCGPAGRSFRLAPAKGRSLRRGSEDVLVLGAPDASETNVARPDLNDPASPALALAGIHGVRLVKGFDPLPNVRGVGEMDDRLLIEEAEVCIFGSGGSRLRFRRTGPFWLGLVSGLALELGRVDDGA